MHNQVHAESCIRIDRFYNDKAKSNARKANI